MAATFAGAAAAGSVVTSESPAATIAPITIERIASSLRHHPEDLSRLRGGDKPAYGLRWMCRGKHDGKLIQVCERARARRARAPRAQLLLPTDLEWCGREDSNLHGLPR